MLLRKGAVRYYRVSGVDNNAYFYGGNKELLKFCSKCKLIVNRYEAAMAAAETFVLKKEMRLFFLLGRRDCRVAKICRYIQ